MSAFEYYAKKGINEDSLNRKRKNHGHQCQSKNKKKLKKIPVKITKNEKGVENSKKPKSQGLNNIYNNLKDSFKTGQKLLEWLIHPISIDDFMK